MKPLPALTRDEEESIREINALLKPEYRVHIGRTRATRDQARDYLKAYLMDGVDRVRSGAAAHDPLGGLVDVDVPLDPIYTLSGHHELVWIATRDKWVVEEMESAYKWQRENWHK